jgi:IMP cyclohydrolase
MLTFDNHIVGNSYPGRGIIVGCSPDGSEVWQFYWIMGRSPNSRNRIFVVDDGVLLTEAADPAKCEDPSLVIYKAMLEDDKNFIVSNGDQTQTVYDFLQKGEGFDSALLTREREPDSPNFTPRISAMVNFENKASFSFSIIKANEANQDLSNHNFFYKNEIKPGEGYCLTTYLHDGNPIPSFSSEPFAISLLPEKEEMLNKIWNTLDNDNKISIAVKSINCQSLKSDISIINKYS